MDIREITDGSLQGDKQRTHHCSWADCIKSFTRKSDLKRHYRIHTNEKPYECGYSDCGKRFVQKSALTVHLRTHSGEKPHCCKEPNCGKRFSDSSSLARHRHTHSGKRTYVCSFDSCNKQFCTKSALSSHHRAHMSSFQSETPPLLLEHSACLDATGDFPRLCVAECPSSRPYHAYAYAPAPAPAPANSRWGDDALANILRGPLQYPTSTCRSNRSDTMSSLGSTAGLPTPPLNCGTRQESDSPSPEPSPAMLPDYLGVLSKAASAQVPLPLPRLPSLATTLRQRTQAQSMLGWSHNSLVPLSGARFAPY
ncbi:hypothetical protein GGI20_005793 [Coemansia sp. BCRC 34301]|nr:hypothetical protein GGI20_005793 [Coemansia sp. BCRC 34301]